MRSTGAATSEYADKMIESGTWCTEKEIMAIVEEIGMEMTVVMMRPRKEEKVIQVFRPIHHNGNMTIVYKPGHFNATMAMNGEITEWEKHAAINARGRKHIRKATAVIRKAYMWHEAARIICVWKQQRS